MKGNRTNEVELLLRDMRANFSRMTLEEWCALPAWLQSTDIRVQDLLKEAIPVAE